MLIPRLRKPKWSHANPEIRLKAVEAGGVPADELVAIVREDHDEKVRQAALSRIDDLVLLEGLLTEHDTERLRAEIRERLVLLLSADPEFLPALSVRFNLVRRITDPVLAEAVARRACSHELRQLALECVNENEVLADIAVNDSVAAVRRTAVERITDPTCWERVARQARKRDKQIARTAREFLEAQRRVEAQREQATHAVEVMERLAQESPTARTRGLYRQMVAGWETLKGIVSSEQLARFEAATQAVDTRLVAYEAGLVERKKACESLGLHLERIETAGSLDGALVEETRRILDEARTRWSTLDDLGAADASMAMRFSELEGRLERRIRDLASEQELAAGARSVIERARVLAESEWDRDSRRIEDLEKVWRKVDRVPGGGWETLQNEFDDCLRTLRAQVARDRERKAQAVREIPGLLDELSRTLFAGELHQAVSLRDKVRHRLRISRGVHDKERRELQQRLSGIQTDLDELLRWRRWGSREARSHLIQEAESLTGSPLPAEDIAARVRVIRREWRRIDRDEGPAAEDLWGRFDKACSAAYTPFRNQQEGRSRQREHNRCLQTALCEELEALERETDWKAVDWRVLDEQVRKVRNRWRRIGPVPNAQRKHIEGRFGEIVDRLEAHLDKERRREIHRRRALIARVEALAGAEDLRKAIDGVKEIQKVWRPAVQAARKEEQALWTEFRAACDKVFERRRETQEAGARERQEHLDRAQGLLDGLATLMADSETDIGRLRQRSRELELEWSGLGPLPKAHLEGLERRFATLKTELGERVRGAELAVAEGALVALEARARLCARLERQALDMSSGDGEAQRAEWAGLSPLKGEDAALLEARFERACAALEGDAGVLEEIDCGEPQALETRLRLCLEAEILAGIDSPPEYAQARMALQVGRLGDALSGQGGGDSARSDSMSLRREWALAGLVRAEQAEGLEARFARALEAMGH